MRLRVATRHTDDIDEECAVTLRGILVVTAFVSIVLVMAVYSFTIVGVAGPIITACVAWFGSGLFVPV